MNGETNLEPRTQHPEPTTSVTSRQESCRDMDLVATSNGSRQRKKLITQSERPLMKKRADDPACLSVPLAPLPTTCGYHRPPLSTFTGVVHRSGSSRRGAYDT